MRGMALTDREIRNTKPVEKDLFLADGGGLYLRVRPTGSKTFLFKSQRGKTRWVTLGRYPELGLADARKKAAALSGTALPEKKTFAEVWQAFYTHKTRELKRPDVIRQQVEFNLLPSLGAKQLLSIKRADVTAVLDEVVRRGSPVSANRCLTYAKQILQYAVDKGWVESNVMTAVRARSVGGTEKARERALSEAEIHELLQWLVIGKAAASTRCALALLLLTGQRVGEVAGIGSADVRGCWWHLPAERTKSKRDHKVYLSPQARMVLRHLPARRPTAYALGQALERFAKAKGTPHFTPHDLRRTMATRLSEHGVAPHVIEKMLNHQMEGVMAVYNHAEYLPERKAAWHLWGRLLNAWRKKTPDSPGFRCATREETARRS